MSDAIRIREIEGERARRRAARELIGRYHDDQLRLLLDHVRKGFEKLDRGEIDPFELDELIHRYKRSAQKLWSLRIERLRVGAGRVDGRVVARARRGGAGLVGGGRATPPAVTAAARRSEPTGSRANIGRVPTIRRFFGISIAMYFDDHGFPHFHARDASGQAKIRIDEVDVIESAMQTRQLRLCWLGPSCIRASCWRTGGGHERVTHFWTSSRSDDRTDP